jgi:hypothetical protein
MSAVHSETFFGDATEDVAVGDDVGPDEVSCREHPDDANNTPATSPTTATLRYLDIILPFPRDRSKVNATCHCRADVANDSPR